MTTLSEQQLKAALTNEQIVRAKTRGLDPEDTVDPVAEEIEAATAKVDAYTAGWIVAAALTTAWARALAAWEVAKRLDTPTTAQKEAKERAERELEDVRDGKFPGLARDASAETAPGAGKVKSGGRDKVL